MWPEIIEGKESLPILAQRIKESGVSKILIVTGKHVQKNTLFLELIKVLDEENIVHAVYDDFGSNPTETDVEAGVKQYLDEQCQGLVVFGGGSKIDCAKAIGARISHPEKSVEALIGILKVKNPIPPLFVIPTTAGSGSEVTAYAVITDSKLHQKFGISSPKLVPKVSLLIPEAIMTLPPKHTAWTGIDALTHAVESYVSVIATKQSKAWSLNGVKLLLDNLEAAYKDGNNIEARRNCQQGAYYAGRGLARAIIGYVHTLSENVGAYYDLEHGLANALFLPAILEKNCPECNSDFATLAIACDLGVASEGTDALAQKFISRIKELLQNLAIPSKMKELRKEDIPMLVDRAFMAGHPGPPVPKFLGKEDFNQIVQSLLPEK